MHFVPLTIDRIAGADREGSFRGGGLEDEDEDEEQVVWDASAVANPGMPALATYLSQMKDSRG